MDDPFKHKLPKLDHDAVFERLKADLFDSVEPVGEPMLLYIGGQPGAGKTTTNAHAVEQFVERGGIVSINFDLLHTYHPSYQHLLKLDETTVFSYTAPDAFEWWEEAVRYGMRLRCNLIIEDVLIRPIPTEQTMKNFHENGYKIDARFLAVNERLSWQGVLLRYEKERVEQGAGRTVSPDIHKYWYDTMVDTVKHIEENGLVSGRLKPASDGRNDPATIIRVNRHFPFNQTHCNSLPLGLFERKMPLCSKHLTQD